MTRAVRHQTFVGTVVQSLPRLRSLIRHMHPTWHLPSLDALDAMFIERHRIDGLIWDVDGTLTPNRGGLAPHVAAAFHNLLALPRLRHAILSNADEARYRALATIFPAVPVIRGYRNGEELIFRRLSGSTETWSHGGTSAGDAAVALRKPNADLIHEAVRALGVDPAAVVMVGDQYLTDVAGAGMAGIRSVKLPTFDRHTFPAPVRTAQWLEGVVHRLLHGQTT